MRGRMDRQTFSENIVLYELRNNSSMLLESSCLEVENRKDECKKCLKIAKFVQLAYAYCRCCQNLRSCPPSLYKIATALLGNVEKLHFTEKENNR